MSGTRSYSIRFIGQEDTGGTVQEDGILKATGKLTAVDSDTHATLTWSVINGNGIYGTLSVDATGTWTYTLDNADADTQALAAGEKVSDAFTVKVIDNHGASATQSVTIRIAGSEDAPVITVAAGQDAGDVVENGPLTASGRLGGSDVDHGSKFAWSVVGGGDGTYGSLSIDGSGKWSYRLDRDSPAVEALAEGERAAETFTIRLSDGQGGFDTHTVVVNIAGTNDAPEITGGSARATVREDVTLTANGRLTASDADHGAQLIWSTVGDGHGTYGNLTVDQQGNWSYALNNGAANVQSLAEGDRVTDRIMVKVTDQFGASSTKVVTIKVIGTDDAPVIAGTATGSVKEDTVASASGQLALVEIDRREDDDDHRGDSDDRRGDDDHGNHHDSGRHDHAGNAWTVDGEGVGTYGSLTVDATGKWTYVLNNGASNVQALAEGESRIDTFTVKVRTGDGDADDTMVAQQVVIAVTGTNDAPLVVGAVTGSATEDGAASTLNALANATDIDNGSALSVADVPLGLPAGVTYDAATHSFTLDPTHAAFQSLAEGQIEAVTVNYGVSDSIVTTAASASWAVTGTNDAPVAVADSNSVAITSIEPAGSFIPLGEEFQVNTYTIGNQWWPSTAALRDGGFVVTWSSEGGDGSGFGVFAQRYDADGSRIGGEFQVNTYTSSTQWFSNVVSTDDGGFVIVWDSSGQDGQGPNEFGSASTSIYAQKFDAAGDKVGAEFLVNTYTPNVQGYANIAALADGGYVVGWSSWGQDGSQYGVFGQVFDAHGDRVGNEFQANTATGGNQQVPEITGLADGGFVFAWYDMSGEDGDSSGIFAQRFDSAGQRAGGEFQVNTYAPGNQATGNVATLADGNFVVVWYGPGADDDYGVFARIFDPSGQALGDQFRLNSTTVDQQVHPKIVPLPDGGFVVDWASYGQDGSGFGVVARSFDQTGHPLGDEMLVNTYTAGDQHAGGRNNMALLTNGNLVVTWQSDNQDGSGIGVFGRLIGLPSATSTTTATGNVLSNDTDVDQGDTHSVSAVNGLAANVGHEVAGTYGRLLLNADGSYNYAIDPQSSGFTGLARGQVAYDRFDYTNSDNHGASDSSSLTISVTGINDAPVVSATLAGSGVEDGAKSTLDALATASDVDAGTTLSAVNVPDNLPAGVTYDSAAHSFTLDPASSAFQHLADGETTTVTVNYGVSDGIVTAAASATWTITGTNDAPTVDSGSPPATGTPSLTTLATFNGANGANGLAGLLVDAAGNLFGSNLYGGPGGAGTVYEIARHGDAYGPLTTIASFNQANGAYPYGQLIADADGNLFGTTYFSGPGGYGTIFELPRDVGGSYGVPVTLATFDFANGAYPFGGLIADAAGNLFGTTEMGGAGGYGTVFEIPRSGATFGPLVTLGEFNLSNGGYPVARLYMNSHGDLFGTTNIGGPQGAGTIFEVANGPGGYGGLTTLVNFDQATGTNPFSGLVADADGNLFGTTLYGGTGSYGTLYELARVGNGFGAPTILANFDYANGGSPYGQLILDANGDLFGTTQNGGAGYGTIYELVHSAGNYGPPVTLVTFNISAGGDPYAGVVADANGNLFGTTFWGGPGGVGTVYELTGSGFVPSGTASGAGATVTDTSTASILTAEGHFSFSDVDLGDTHAAAVTDQSGNLGTLTAVVTHDTTGIGTGGAIDWTYEVAEALVQPLGAGETHIDTFTVMVSDGHGGSASQQVSVTIIGADPAGTADMNVQLAGVAPDSNDFPHV